MTLALARLTMGESTPTLSARVSALFSAGRSVCNGAMAASFSRFPLASSASSLLFELFLRGV
eukprot:2241510-Prymnesium_polylepis.1